MTQLFIKYIGIQTPQLMDSSRFMYHASDKRIRKEEMELQQLGNINQ